MCSLVQVGFWIQIFFFIAVGSNAMQTKLSADEVFQLFNPENLCSSSTETQT